MLIDYFLAVVNTICFWIYSLCGFCVRNLKQHRYGVCTGFAKHFAEVPGKGVPTHRPCSSTRGKKSKEARTGELTLLVFDFHLVGVPCRCTVTMAIPLLSVHKVKPLPVKLVTCNYRAGKQAMCGPKGRA